MIALTVGALACVVWAYLLIARGAFWLCRENDDLAPGQTAAQPAGGWPDVVAVIPARNEAEVIADTVLSLVRQRYGGNFSIIVVDDASYDGTGAIAAACAVSAGASARFTVITAPPLASGWTGKLWAQAHGLAQIQQLGMRPAFVLLSDADIVYAPESLAELVAQAEGDGLVLSSRMARLHCDSRAERLLIPAFIFFFRMIYPFQWVNDRRRHTAAAAGGCMLLRWSALQAAGGLAAIRGNLIDDCALARLMKPLGPVRLVLSRKVQSSRRYRSSRGIREMIVRSAYAQLRFSPILLVGTLIAMSLTYLAPALLAVAAAGLAAALGAGAWALMTLAFHPTLRFYGVAPWRGVLLPVIALIYMVFTLQSAVLHGRGRGGLWKGRTYDHPPES